MMGAMFGWHLTWQDPVALALAAGCVIVCTWLYRRGGGAHDCGTCPIAPPVGDQRRSPPSMSTQRPVK